MLVFHGYFGLPEGKPSWMQNPHIFRKAHLGELILENGPFEDLFPIEGGNLGGRFKHVLFLPRKLGKIPIWTHIFQWAETTN